jgi:hypothetical protein
MAMRDHIRHTMDLQHQTWRNCPWLRTLPSVFVHNRDSVLFGYCCCQSFETRRWVNSANRGISECEWLRYAHHISECVDGGYASTTIRNQWSRDRGLGLRVVMHPSPPWPLTLSPLLVTCVRGTDLCLAPMDSDPAQVILGGPSMSRVIACLFPHGARWVQAHGYRVGTCPGGMDAGSGP